MEDRRSRMGMVTTLLNITLAALLCLAAAAVFNPLTARAGGYCCGERPDGNPCYQLPCAPSNCNVQTQTCCVLSKTAC